MTYSNAGHSAPVVYRKDTGEFFDLEARGKPLGWFTEIDIEEKTLQLKKNDRIILYTDGITECINSNKELFETERFKERLVIQITCEAANEVKLEIIPPIDKRNAFQVTVERRQELRLANDNSVDIV